MTPASGFICVFIYLEALSGTHSEDQAGLELRDLRASASLVLELKHAPPCPVSLGLLKTFGGYIYYSYIISTRSNISYIFNPSIY